MQEKRQKSLAGRSYFGHSWSLKKPTIEDMEMVIREDVKTVFHEKTV